MALLVDIPMQGSGNTNSGNTARRFFEQYELSAEITGVNENLIRRLGVILRSMASGYAINIDSFREYALQTAKMFVSEYPWYYMPSSVHRILLPIGMMSEEEIKIFRSFG